MINDVRVACHFYCYFLATVSNAKEAPLSILEMGGFGQSDRSLSPTNVLPYLADSNELESGHPFRHQNSPCWTWAYTDHQKKNDFVCVALPALCGKNAKFTISEDGMQIHIRYEWPEVMFKATQLFSKSTVDKVNKITSSHPKIHSFISHLNKSGVTEKSTLHSNITINLPQKVQRENDSWSMEKVLVSDTKMILLEFSAYQKTLILNDADTSLDF